MKVYIITTGDYSAYRICAVTLEEKRAQELKAFYTTDVYGEAQIEEWDTDEARHAAAGEKVWFIRFDEAGNAIVKAERMPWEYDKGIRKVNDRLGGIAMDVMAKTEEAAVKIAAERRAKWLAGEAGI